MDPLNDIHGYTSRLRRWFDRIEESYFNKENKDTVLRFIEALKVYGIGIAKLIN